MFALLKLEKRASAWTHRSSQSVLQAHVLVSVEYFNKLELDTSKLADLLGDVVTQL